MTYEQIERHFGGFAATVAKLGLPKTTVHSWKARGHVPWARQFDIEQVTGGKLRADKRNGKQ